MVLYKNNWIYGLLHKLQNLLPTNLLGTVDNFFIRSHLGYSYIIYFHAYYYFFDKKLESIQYDTRLAIMGLVGGTLIENQ